MPLKGHLGLAQQLSGEVVAMPRWPQGFPTTLLYLNLSLALSPPGSWRVWGKGRDA